MKKLFLLLTLFTIAFKVQAQDTTSNAFKPTTGDKVMSIGLFNNTAFWALKKYKNETTALRFGILGDYNCSPKKTTEITSTDPNNPNIPTYSSSSKQMTDFSIGLFGGLQKTYLNIKRVEPYLGADISFMYKYYSYTDEGSYSNNNTINTKSYKSTEQRPLNLNLSFLPFIGLNYYFAPRFAIGAEYRVNVFSVSYTGEIKVNSTSTDLNNNTFEREETTKSLVAFKGGFTGSAFITLTMLLK